MARKKTLNATELFRSKVIAFTKSNWAELNRLNKNVDSNIESDIKNDDLILQWMVGEVLLNFDKFRDQFVVRGEDDNEANKTFETVYNIGNRYIRQITNYGDYQQKPSSFEFVKRVKRRVTVYDYVPA